MTRDPDVHSRQGGRRWLSLRSEMFLAFGLLFLAVIIIQGVIRTFGIPFSSYQGAYGAICDDVFARLSLVADLKKEWLSLWLQQRNLDANLFARMLEPSAQRLREIARRSLERGGDAQDDSRKNEVIKEINNRLNMVTSYYTVYRKIQVADARSGVVLASSDRKDLGVNISDRQFFKNAVEQVNEVRVGFEKDPLAGKTYMVASIATRRSGGVDEGFTPVTAMYIDTDEFIRPMLYKGEGLGETGEIVLVDQDLRIVMSLNHPLPDGTTVHVLEDRIKGEPAILAAGGKEGTIAGNDYRGVPVLAAYRHLVVTPDLSLVMVVKRDRSEVFWPIWRQLFYSFTVGAFGTVALLILGILVANGLSRPIRRLSETAEEVGAGNLNARAAIEGSREVRILSATFNSMIDRMRNWYEELQEQVKARTHELTESNEQLALAIKERQRTQKDLAHEKERLAVTLSSIGDGVISADTEAKVISINPVAESITGWTEAEAIGRPLAEVFHVVNEHTWERCENPVESVLATGKVCGLANDTVLIARDGTERIIADSGAPIVDSTGRTIGVVLVFRDSTGRRRAQRELRKSQERLELALAGADLGMWDWDLKAGEAVWSERAVTMLGYSTDEVKPNFRFWKSLIHPDDWPKVSQALDDHLEGRLPFYEAEYRIRSKSGEWKWILARGQVGEWDANGKPLRLIGTTLDIDERKRAEESLRRTEHLLRSILSTSPVGIGLARDRQMVWVNEAWVKLFGFENEKEEEYLRRDTRMFYPSDEEYDRAGKILYDAMHAGQTSEADVKFKRKDGTLFDAHVSMNPLDPSDPGQGTIAAVTDISDRKRSKEALRASEERYRTIFANSPLGIIHFDRNGVIVDFNDKFVEIIGSSREKLIGFNMPEGQRDERMRQAVSDALDGKVSRYEGDYLSVTGGKLTPMRAVYSRIVSNDGDFIAGVGIFEDITEQKNLQKQLFQAQKMEAVGILAGGVAHDFNNFLTVVQGYSELLLSDRDECHPDYADLEKIAEAARRGTELVRNLLAFSKQADSSPRPMNLNHEVMRIEELLDRTMPKLIKIELHLDGGLATTNADPGQMGQVLMNLAVNAEQAMPDGGKLAIATTNVFLDDNYCSSHIEASPGEYVLLTFSDTGHGMGQETLVHIFDPFFTTKGPGKGTGLGLAMVYGIVQQHAGHITCESEPGQGTTVKVYLPAIKETEAPDEAKMEKVVPKGGTETILLVDDEDFIRELGKTLLTRAGYTVLTASNGPAALEIYSTRSDEIALVILDMIMPEMSGEQCLQEILAVNPNAKIIIASGAAIEGSKKEIIDSRARGFVSKPFQLIDMLKSVRDVLDAN